MLSEVGGGGLASVLDVQSWFLLLKKIGFALWSDIMLIIYYWQEIFLLTLTFSFDSDSESFSDVTHWSHLLMIALHYLWTKSNNRTRDHFECDVTFFGLFVWFRCRCCSIVCLHFEVRQIKHVNCKMRSKKRLF